VGSGVDQKTVWEAEWIEKQSGERSGPKNRVGSGVAEWTEKLWLAKMQSPGIRTAFSKDYLDRSHYYYIYCLSSYKNIFVTYDKSKLAPKYSECTEWHTGSVWSGTTKNVLSKINEKIIAEFITLR
jgi:hypothetical protein